MTTIRLDEYSTTPLYNIKAVVQSTNISPSTLRAWERRYNMCQPQRSESGYRLYSDRDVAIIRWLKMQVDAGMAISQAVTWLQNLIDLAPTASQAPVLPEPMGGLESARPQRSLELANVSVLQQRLLHALLAYQEDGAEAVLAHAFALYSIEQVGEEVIMPVLVEIGDRWHRGLLSVTREHYATNYLIQRLAALLRTVPNATNTPLIWVGCAPDEQHEIGAKEWESAIDAALTPTKSKQEIKIDLAAAAALRIESEAVRQRLIVEGAEPATDEDGAPSPAPPQRQVRIDPSAAESLRIESEAVRQRLMIEGAAGRELAIEDWATAAALPQTDAVSSDPSHQQPAAEFADAYLQRPEDAPSGLLTDLPSIFKIMGGPGEDRSQLLRVMRDMGWQALPSALAAQFAGQFINVTIDHINEISYGELGDALLFDEGDLWVVTEDYRDEIVHILDHPDYLQF